MSLKNFHIVFISLSILLAFGFGIWGINFYSVSDNTAQFSLGIISILVGVGLIIYGRKIYQRLKKI